MKNINLLLHRIGSNVFLNHFFVGAISALSFAPFNLCFPLVLGLGWFFANTIVEEISLKKALFSSFLFFLGIHIVGLYWLVYPLTINFEKHWFLIPFAIILVPAYFSVQLLLAVFFTKKYCHSIFQKAFVFTACISLIIYFYGHYFPGFPWILPGYIWGFHEIFLQILCIFGIYGLSFVTIFLSCLSGAAFLFHKKKDRRNLQITLGTTSFIIFAMLVFGLFRLSFNKTEYTKCKVRVVQCNIPQEEKNDRRLSLQNLKKHITFSRHDSKLDFVIWPEASIPYLYHEKFEQLHDFLKIPLKIGEHLIAGAVRKDLSSANIYNSVVFIDYLGRNISNYDKTKLVPFGEYVPLRKYIPFQSIAGDIGDFDVGRPSRVIEISGFKIAIAICYEAIFPLDFIPRGDRSDVIINITNDGWFGFTSEPFQHLQIVKARAIETGVPVIRSTNYGISAVFDAYGREVGRVPINRAGFIDCYIPKTAPETPYNRFGDLLFFFLIAVSLLLSYNSSGFNFRKL